MIVWSIPPLQKMGGYPPISPWIYAHASSLHVQHFPTYLNGRDDSIVFSRRFRRVSRSRVFRDRSDPLEFYDDLELMQCYRFSRSAILGITEIIVDHLNSTNRFHAAHPHVQVCVPSQFFASGTFQIICGDGVHVSQPSACRYIRAVALGLQSVYSKFICMPGSAEKATIKSQFYQLANRPSVLGLVDGTHIRIQKPSKMRLIM